MLAKVIAHGGDRAEALRRLDEALGQMAVLGVGTNVDFLRFVLADADVRAGRLDTELLERLDYRAPDAGDDVLIAAAAARWLGRWPGGPADPWDVPSGWRLGRHAPTTVRLRCGERTEHVHITGTPADAQARIEDGPNRSLKARLVGDELAIAIDGIRHRYTVARTGGQTWLAGDGRTVLADEVREAPVRAGDEHSGDAELTSPMPGSVVAVNVSDGDTVDAGTVVVAVEAMKMEHSLRAPVAGTVKLLVGVGEQVTLGQPLAVVNTEGAD